MKVSRITSSQELVSLAADWHRLAGDVPFRSWSWLGTWWTHFGAEHDLYVLLVHDTCGTLVGIAPWYLEHTRAQGRVVRPLGSGEVCSDHLGLLAGPQHYEEVAQALADWLTDAALEAEHDQPRASDRWDLLQLGGIDGDDAAIGYLLEHLEQHGHRVHGRAGPNCWRTLLPKTWEELLGSFSKSHRKRMRRLQRQLVDSGQATLHEVTDPSEFERGWKILVELHQRRRQSIGQAGCFSCERMARFLHQAARELLLHKQLGLQWVQLDGRPVAAEFQLIGADVTYAYQAGIDPTALDQQPGHLSTILTVQKAIADGQRTFDFLRGDEPYKAFWNAAPQPSLEVRVVPPRTVPQIRHGAWIAGGVIKDWIKGGLELTGAR